MTFPIVLDGGAGETVSLMNFRFEYDPSQFELVAVEPGAAALESNKRVEWNVPTPGECIVVVMNMSQNECPPGTVAHVVTRRKTQDAQGSSQFELADPALASPEGASLDAEGRGRTLEWGEQPAGPADPGVPEGSGGLPDAQPDNGAGASDVLAPESGERPWMPLEDDAGREASAAAPQTQRAPDTVTQQADRAGRDMRAALERADRLRGQVRIPGRPELAETGGNGAAAQGQEPSETSERRIENDMTAGRDEYAAAHSAPSKGPTVESQAHATAVAGPTPGAAAESNQDASNRGMSIWVLVAGLMAAAAVGLAVMRRTWMTR